MSQHSFSIPDQSGATFLTDLNAALDAIASTSAGASQPGTTYPYQLWADTTAGLLKIRNGANSAWVTIGALGSANLGLAALAGATFSGAVSIPTLTLVNALSIANGGTGATNAASAFAALKQAATASATGVVELATGAEYRTATDANRAVTPAALADGSFANVNGRVWLPGGLLLQWGWETVNLDIPAPGLDVSLVFPVAFNSVYIAPATTYSRSGNLRNNFVVNTALSTAGATYRCYEGTAGVQTDWGLFWFAIGK